MSQQPSLLDNPYIDISRGSAAPTSQAANKKVAPKKAQDRERILGYLRWNGTGTLKDITSILRMPVQTASARISECLAAGLAERTGERRDGCGVIRLTQAGKDAGK